MSGTQLPSHHPMRAVGLCAVLPGQPQMCTVQEDGTTTEERLCTKCGLLMVENDQHAVFEGRWCAAIRHELRAAHGSMMSVWNHPNQRKGMICAIAPMHADDQKGLVMCGRLSFFTRVASELCAFSVCPDSFLSSCVCSLSCDRSGAYSCPMTLVCAPSTGPLLPTQLQTNLISWRLLLLLHLCSILVVVRAC